MRFEMINSISMKDIDISNMGINIELGLDERTVCIEIYKLSDNMIVHRFYNLFPTYELASDYIISITNILTILGGQLLNKS